MGPEPTKEGDDSPPQDEGEQPAEEVEQKVEVTEEPVDESEQAELTDVDLPDPENNPSPSEEVEALATFSEQEGPLSFRIIPVIEGGETDWRIVAYLSGTQGPVYQSREGLTNEAASQFGISARLRDRVNDALEYAKEELRIPEGLGDQKREKRSLHELEVMMSE